MKEVLIILDGLMEKAFESINIGEFILGDIEKEYSLRYHDFSVEGKDIDSLNCIMNIFGYSPLSVNIGDRAYYEALSQGIVDYNYVLRCNIVKIEEGKLKDFTGGRLPLNIGSIIKNIPIENGYVHPCYSYKNLLVLNSAHDIMKLKFHPPHFNVGEDILSILPNSGYIKNIINTSWEFFDSIAMKGYSLWPWGPSKKVKLESFSEKHLKTAGIISGIDLVHGMGLALGMKSIMPSKVTGDFDTNLENKLNEALKMINSIDLLIVHINGFDELAHRKDLNGKIEFMKRVRKEFLKPLIKGLKPYNASIKITCDHRSDSFTGKHEKGNVPIIGIE